jgi:hypothetical protein
MKNLFQRGPIDIEIRLRTWASNAVDCLYKTMFLEAADLIQDLRKKYKDKNKAQYQYLSGRGRKHNDDETDLQGKGKEQ